MSVLIDKDTKVIVQGITGNQGSFHTKLMLEYGTKIVAGVTPGKGSSTIEGIPVYGTVEEALKKHKADYSIIFVPARFAKAAALEALDNNLNIVLITEGIPILDAIHLFNVAKLKERIVIGPNTPGLISPGKCKLGIMPSYIFKEGDIGVISRSGTLTYEIINALSKSNLGQSTVIGIGGDRVVGLDFVQALNFFEADKQTEKIVIIGEIGGNLEEMAAEFIKDNVKKKVVAYIAGLTAPSGKKMGHAGALIQGSSGTAQSKIEAFKEAKVKVAKLPSEIVKLLIK